MQRYVTPPVSRAPRSRFGLLTVDGLVLRASGVNFVNLELCSKRAVDGRGVRSFLALDQEPNT